MRQNPVRLVSLAAIATAVALAVSGCVITNVGNPLDALTGSTPIPTPAANAVTVTDEFGTYTRITSAESGGVSSLSKNASADERARAWAVDFILSQALDSIALGDASQWDSWVTEVAPDYLDARALKKLGRDGNRPILSAPDIALVVNHLARNGASRWDSTAVTEGTVERVAGSETELVVRAQGNGSAPLESGALSVTFTASYTIHAKGGGWIITAWDCHWNVARS